MVDRPACAFIGLTYGLGAGFEVARESAVSKLTWPGAFSLVSGMPSGLAPELSDLNAARLKTSSRMWSRIIGCAPWRDPVLVVLEEEDIGPADTFWR